MSVNKAIGEKDLIADEERAKRQLSAWVEAFIDMPTDHNMDGVALRMTEYRAAWMNGRNRPA